MTPVDLAILLLCVVSAGVGLWRGFTKEALSLATLLAAIWLAWRFAPLVEPGLTRLAGGTPEVRIWVARAIVFVLVLVAGAVASWLARTLIRHTGLSGVDRLLGAAFGVLRAVVIVGIGLIALQFFELDQDAWWQEARLRPYAERAAAAVRYYAELGNRYFDGSPAAAAAAPRGAPGR